MDTVSIEAQLDEWLDDALAELDEEPTTLDHTGKLVGALRGVERRITEVDAYVARRIADLRQFQAEQRDPLVRRQAHLQGLIGGWALAEWERTGRKTWKLPEGKIEVRPLAKRAEVDATTDVDDSLMDAVATVVPTAVKVERSVLVGQVKAAAAVGAPVDGYPHVPDGYEAHQAVVNVDGTDTVVPGVVLLVPKPGRAGQVVRVNVNGGSR